MKKFTEEETKAIEDYLSEVMGDLELFAKTFVPHIVTHEVPSFHKQIYEALPNESRLIIASFRGSGKSRITSIIYPLWLALIGNFRKDICIISASETLAVELLRAIKKELEQNHLILKYFKDLRTDKWSESHIILKNGVNVRAKGQGGQIRGFRPDCLILDDLETNETVESEEQRKKLKEWVFKDCLNTLLPESQLVVVGSILHQLSLVNDLLSTSTWPKYNFMGYKDQRQEEGNESWPAMWPHSRLQERKREIGSFAFSQEFMNNPLSDETAPIRENQIRYWDSMPTQYSLVIAVDPAYSEDEKSDYKVAALVAIDQNHNRYLVNYLRTHAPTGEFINSVLNMYLQNKAYITGIGIPCSGTEKEFFRSFVQTAESRKLYPPFHELKNVFYTATGESKRNKKARIIASLQPLFESGKYYIHRNHTEAREELLTIGSSRWDDLVDALCYAEQIIRPVFMESPRERFQEPVLTAQSNYGI